MKALVTGGGGFLGGRITEMLLQRGDQVRIFGRSSHPRLEKLGAEVIVGDIRDTSALNMAAEDVSAVFHTAAKTDLWGEREEFYQINSRGTANVIQACLLNNVPKLIHTSTPSVVFTGNDIINGDENLPYSTRFKAAYPASKMTAEKMVLDAHGWEFVIEEKKPEEKEITERHASTVRRLSTCVLRPHLVWGPGDPNFLPEILGKGQDKSLRQVGDGSNEVSITYIDNAAQAHLAAANKLSPDSVIGGKAYFITDKEPIRLWEWINQFLKRNKLPPVKKNTPFRLAYSAGAAMETFCNIFPRLGPPPMTRFMAEQLAKSHSFSWQRARRDFGYEPMIDNETGIQRLLESLND